MLRFGSLPHIQAVGNIERFARDVLPALQALDDRNYQGFEIPKAASALAR